MGGMGSGARRSTHIGNVEDVLALDIRVLRRLGVVHAGECICETVRWSIGGPSTPSARLRVDVSDIERGGIMMIAGNMPDGVINQQVAIDAVPSGFGGQRHYCICPITSQHCEILYYANGRFASRAAQRLTYASQNMGDLSRVRHKAAKLRRRLFGTDTVSRPRGRNRIAMVERLWVNEREVRAIYFDKLCAAVHNQKTEPN